MSGIAGDFRDDADVRQIFWNDSARLRCTRGWTSDFMDLRGGSLLRADGGFLIMYALEWNGFRSPGCGAR